MSAFNKTRINEIIPSHHCPTLTSTLKAPPVSAVAEAIPMVEESPISSSVTVSASAKKPTPKVAPAKGKPLAKHQFVVAQHYAAKNPYAKKPSSEFEASDDDWMLEVPDEE